MKTEDWTGTYYFDPISFTVKQMVVSSFNDEVKVKLNSVPYEVMMMFGEGGGYFARNEDGEWEDYLTYVERKNTLTILSSNE